VNAAPDSPFLTTAEAAAIIRMDRDYVTRQCESGAIPAKKLGRMWRIHRDDLDRFMAPGKAPVTRPDRRRAS
jgi:excisionase family DNA binding protein